MRAVLPASLTLLAGFGLACSGGSAPAPEPPPLKPVTVTPVAPQAPATFGQAPDQGFDGIRAAGRLRVAADPEAPPFLSRAATGGYEGFEYAIMAALASAAGAEAVIVPAKFEELADKVRSGEADLAIGQIAPSSAYEGMAFSVSYLQYSLCLVVPAASPVKSLSELGGKRVAMYDDPVARQVADVLIGASYQRQLVNDYGYFEKMVRGQLDAMVYDCPLARHEMKTYGDQLRIASDALNVATYAVMVPATSTRLLADVNRAVKGLGEQGLLASLEEKWLGGGVQAADYETATGRVVVVRRGESLSAIARRELGDVERWREIYEVNADVVGVDPNEIYVGMRLRMPKR